MSTSASDEISRLGRLEGEVLAIAESVPHMQEELERLRARTTELTRGLSSEREGRVNLSDFLELRGTDGWPAPSRNDKFTSKSRYFPNPLTWN